MKPIQKILIIKLCLTSVLFANNPLDSLKNALKKANHDSVRLNIYAQLNEICEESEIFVYADSIINLADNLIKKGAVNKTILLKFKGDALNNIGVAYETEGNNGKAIEFYNKSVALQKQIGNSEGAGIALVNMGVVYEKFDTPKATECFMQGLKLFNAIKNKKGMAYIFNKLGEIYQGQGNISEALKYYTNSLKLNEEIKDKEGEATSLNNIAFVYGNQGNISECINYFHESLMIREKIGNKKGMANTLCNLGVVYSGQGEKQKAVECYTKALKLAEQIKDKQTIANAWHNLAVQSENNQEALKYYLKSLSVKQEIEDKQGMAFTLFSIGIIHKNSKRSDSALYYYSKSLNLFELLQHKQGLSYVLSGMGVIFKNNGEYAKAMQHGIKALTFAKEIGYPENIKRAAQLLAETCKKSGKWQQAFEMHELFVQMRDSINNQETRRSTLKKQFQYAYERKASADSIKHIEEKKITDTKIALQKAELEKEKIQRYALFFGLAIIAIFTFFLFNRFKITKRQKAIIERQKHMVVEKQKEILDSIYYASRIQQALLPSEKYIEKQFNRLRD